MPITFPFPVRVSVGLVLTGVDHLRALPSDLPTLGVSAAGQAMRWSMRLQQEFADLAVRGDEVLSKIGGPPPEHPAWATFDEEEPDPDGEELPVVAVIEDGAVLGALMDQEDELADNDVDSDGYAGEPIQELAEVIALDLVAAARSGAAGSAAAPSDVDATAAEPVVDVGSGASADDPPAIDTVGRPATESPVDAESPLDATAVDTDSPLDAAAVDAESLVNADVGAGPENGAADEVDYDSLTLAQLRGTLRRLSADDVTELLDRERSGADRPAFVTLLTNRLTSLEQGHP